MGKQWKQCLTLFLGGSKITADGDCSHEIRRCLLLGRKVMNNLDSIFKSRDITLPRKVHLVKAMVFPVVMNGCESWTIKKESWAPKNWCFWTVVLEKTLESPLDCKEIQPVHPNRDQSWVSIGRTDVEAETPILCPPDAKSWLIGKDPDAGKDWGKRTKGRQMIRRLDSITDSMDMSLSKLWETVEVRGESWVLVTYRPWGCKELEMTEWLSNNIKYSIVYMYFIFFIRFFQWTFRLLPCFGCCKTWLWALGCMYLSELQFSPGTCPGVALLDHTALFLIFEEPPHFSP